MSQSNKRLESYERTVESSDKKMTMKEKEIVLDSVTGNSSHVAKGCGNCSGCKC